MQDRNLEAEDALHVLLPRARKERDEYKELFLKWRAKSEAAGPDYDWYAETTRYKEERDVLAQKLSERQETQGERARLIKGFKSATESRDRCLKENQELSVALSEERKNYEEYRLNHNDPEIEKLKEELKKERLCDRLPENSEYKALDDKNKKLKEELAEEREALRIVKINRDDLIDVQHVMHIEAKKLKKDRDHYKEINGNQKKEIEICWNKLKEFEVSSTAPKGRKFFTMRKLIIVFATGLLAGNLPISDMASATKDFFVGSNIVFTGDYDTIRVCNAKGCGATFEHWPEVALCNKCGNTELGMKIAAPLYRNRTFPLPDAQVGIRYKNDDGTTTVVLTDGSIIPE